MMGESKIKNWNQCVGVLIFSAALLYAAVMDHKYQKVRRGIWIWAGTAAFLLFCVRLMWRGEDCLRIFLEILSFIALQFLFFKKLYGTADCFAFSCCGIFLGAFGGGIKECLLHMLLSIGILGIIQFFKGNIDRRGNLRHPKAFIPYISAALPFIILRLLFF